ncbi:MAG: ABC transporter ATP-binding protein, partial [Spirochaetota bacterium]
MAELILRNVSKTYRGAAAVEHVDLKISDREFAVIVGPSGCGKTTLLRMIAGLEELSSGDIFVDGRNITKLPPKDRDIAMVFQNFALYPHMTVEENIAFPLKIKKLPKDEIRARVADAASILGITDLLSRLPHALSGGQKQRVAIGRVIVRKPKLFMYDEPLSGLDAQLRHQLRSEISSLHEKLGATTVMVKLPLPFRQPPMT